MWDIFKSRETKLYEKGLANGLGHFEARRRASQATNSNLDLNSAGRDAFIHSGNFVDARRRQSGVESGQLSGAAKEYYLRSGDYLGARRLQSLI